MKTVDPYYEWLGIPPKDQPPNHYRLLGLELFEENRSVIDAAANRQMSFIKEYQAGADSELSQKLLNELSAARLCLLSAPAKAAYDTQLRAQLRHVVASLRDAEASTAYDEPLRAQLRTQTASAPAMPIPPAFRWRNESDSPHAPPDGRVSPSPLASGIPLPIATPLDARPGLASSNAVPAVTERWSGILPRSEAGLGALAVAAGLLVAALAIVLALVLASPHWAEPTPSVEAVAQGPRELPANTETSRSEASVAEPVAASEPPTFSTPSEPRPAPARTAESDDSQPLPPPTVVPATTKVTQTAPPQSPVIVVERIEPVPVPTQQPGAAPVIVPSAELAKTTAPPPPPVETLEQTDRRLYAAAEQASSSAERQAVARELLSLADKAILDSQTELARRVVERALAEARKSESDNLVKQATLLWSELQKPLTDEAKERARQRLGEAP